MPFHHVLIALESEPTTLKCLFTDLSEEELNARFALPYRKGKDLFCGNEVVSIARIHRVHIVRTEHASGDVLRTSSQQDDMKREDLNRGSSGLVFLDLGNVAKPELLLKAGEDVTARFVLGPPGAASEQSPVLRFLNHQWTVAVGGGLILAGLVWWFGWS